jgi:hypothetical protein
MLRIILRFVPFFIIIQPFYFSVIGGKPYEGNFYYNPVLSRYLGREAVEVALCVFQSSLLCMCKRT